VFKFILREHIMFKLIGLVVVIAVVFLGYPALSSWYSGESTPKEAVTDVRNLVGTALITDVKGTGNNAPDQQSKTHQSTPPVPQKENSQEPLNANQMIKNMMKD